MSLDISQQPIKSNALFCSTEHKRNMWMYYYYERKTLFIMDPITPTTESITLIADLDTHDIYFVLTACQHKKKQNLVQWKFIFPYAKIITPDSTFHPNEHILVSDTIYPFNNEISFLSMKNNSLHSLCMKVYRYLFLGEISEPYTRQTLITETANQFFDPVNKDSIVFPSFGPINVFSKTPLFQQIKKSTSIPQS